MPYSYYAVKEGTTPGIYTSWIECKKAIAGFDRPVYKGFNDLSATEDFIAKGRKSLLKKIEDDRTRLYFTVKGEKRKFSVVYSIDDGEVQEKPIPGNHMSNAAMIAALALILPEVLEETDKLVIVTENDYVIGIFTRYLKTWKAKGEVENKRNIDLILEVDDLLTDKDVLFRKPDFMEEFQIAMEQLKV